jgi:hypothetical protein
VFERRLTQGEPEEVLKVLRFYLLEYSPRVANRLLQRVRVLRAEPPRAPRARRSRALVVQGHALLGHAMGESFAEAALRAALDVLNVRPRITGAQFATRRMFAATRLEVAEQVASATRALDEDMEAEQRRRTATVRPYVSGGRARARGEAGVPSDVVLGGGAWAGGGA